ncbi:alpha/beta fold hydrolase [Flagellimonas sp. S174]|uniref:alpha/beta fold hydrolase n=1 Tax=Flagellimonas sp. S174 TaxID=3410790 RepID=UPI003BF5774A
MRQVAISQVKFIEVNGYQIAHRIIGKGTPPLILFNRFRGTINDWDPSFISVLSKKNKVIVFDNLGVGSTIGQSSNTIEGMAEVAKGFIDKLGLKSVNVLGWSMGGLVAQVFLLHYPDLVKKAILIGTGPGGSDKTEYPTEKFLNVATKVYDMKPEDHQTVFFTDDSSGYDHTLKSLSRIEKYKDQVPLTKPETWVPQGEATKGFFLSDKDYFNKIKEINQPVLVAGAKEDISFSDNNSFLLFKQIPNSQLVLYSNAAHAFHHQMPNQFGQVVVDFLKD